MSTLRFNVRSNLGSNICSALCSKDRTNIFYPGTHSNAGSGRIAKDSAHCNGPSAIKCEGLRFIAAGFLPIAQIFRRSVLNSMCKQPRIAKDSVRRVAQIK